MSRKIMLPPLIIGAVFFCVLSICRVSSAPALRVSLNATTPITSYDPASIQYNNEYFLLENIFSPLLEYSAGDELVSGVAEKFEWVGNEARFTMRTGLKTIDGHPVDAKDAELSLKRLFILGGPDYDLLRGMLCGTSPLKSISDACPGLEVRDGGHVLVMKFRERKTFLFHFLTNISYAVIPRGSIAPGTLKLTDYRNTSGPYFISADAGGGSMEMKANPFHYRYSADIPQQIKIIPLSGYLANDSLLTLLSGGQTDYLMNGVVRNPGDKSRFVAANPGYNIHISQPTRLICVVFTERGLRRLSLKERFFIAARLRRLYSGRHDLCETPYQIFKMEGALSRQQLLEIHSRLDAPGDMVIKKKLMAQSLYSYFWLDEDAIKQIMPAVGYSDRPPLNTMKKPPAPDFYILGCDIGFQDDVGLLSYYLGMDFFKMSAAEKNSWFAAYAAAPDKKERMRMLRALHYDNLVNARALPLALQPYASVAREPWTFRFPGMVSGDQLWRLRRSARWTLK